MTLQDDSGFLLGPKPLKYSIVHSTYINRYCICHKIVIDTTNVLEPKDLDAIELLIKMHNICVVCKQHLSNKQTKRYITLMLDENNCCQDPLLIGHHVKMTVCQACWVHWIEDT